MYSACMHASCSGQCCSHDVFKVKMVVGCDYLSTGEKLYSYTHKHKSSKTDYC